MQLTTANKPPVYWTLLLSMAATRMVLYGLSSGPLAYGPTTDELYFWDCTNHLAWGYADFPPFSIAALSLMRVMLGDSLLAIRLLAALSHATAIIATGLTAREMGGGRAAQGLAALFVLTSPIITGVTAIYSMNVLEIALWSLGGLILARLLRQEHRRLWVLLGIVVGVGLLNKVSMLWFAGGFALGSLTTPQRRWLATPGPWLSGSIALVMVLPTVIWQLQNNWPMLEFLRITAEVKQLAYTSPFEFIIAQLVVTGVPFWIFGLCFYFSSAGRNFRLLGWIWIAVFSLLLASGAGKAYYLAPAYPLLLAGAGLTLERLAQRWKDSVRTAAVVASVAGIVSLPMTLSIVPPAQLAAALGTVGAPEQLTFDVTQASPLPQHFAQSFHGEAVALSVAAAYEKLSDADQSQVMILTQHFGETGGINYYGRELGLPRSVGTNVGYWFFGPGEHSGEIAIVLSDSEPTLRKYWRSIERASEINCEYCMPYLTRKSVYIVRGLVKPLSEIWAELKELA